MESQLRPVAAQDWRLLSHNAFGICGQVIIGSDSPVDGFVKVQASLNVGSSINAVETERAEVVVFDPLKSVAPNYEDHLLKYHSKDQEGQEFWTFAEFIPKVTTGYSRRVNVAHGSHASLKLAGGSNFWESLHGKYETSWEIEPADGGLQLSTGSVNFTQSEVDIHCGQPANPSTDLHAQQSYLVTIKQKNQVSRDLLQPKTHVELIEVVCGAPVTHRILWAQKPSSTEKEYLPRSRATTTDKRLHYVLAGSEHQIRSLSALKDGSCLIADDSLLKEQTVDNATLAKVDEHGLVTFADEIGRVRITETVRGLKPDSLSGKSSGFFGGGVSSSTLRSLYNGMSDRLEVAVVYPARIQPRAKTIYFNGQHNQYKFLVEHGSGNFRVELNDTSIASQKLVGRELLIIPKAEGALNISIYDEDIPTSPIAVSTLTISGIAMLTLDTPYNLIE